MLIASLPVPAPDALPSGLKAMARSKTIEMRLLAPEDGRLLPHWHMTADVWIGCQEAWPHKDPQWRGQLFLTLCVLGDHEICDEKTESPVPIKAGSLCIVDPMCRHWLRPREQRYESYMRPFLALQWEVRKKDAQSKAQDLVEKAKGIWETEPSAIGRYAKWRDEAVLMAA